MKPIVCSLLRTKSSFGQVVDQQWGEGADPTAVHWCLATMESFGPDEHHVHAHECREGRRCFQRPPEADPAVASAPQGKGEGTG